MANALRRLFSRFAARRQRLGLAGQPWSRAGTRMLAAHIAETTWPRAIGRMK